MFLVGLAIILALVFGAASTALGANGDAWKLGKGNVATAITKLAGTVGVDGPMLRLDNNNAGISATALDLQVEPGHAPMSVNSSTQVSNLNADQVDGRSASTFVADDIYRRESAIDAGTALGDGTFSAAQACDTGDTLITGGAANINSTSTLLETFPSPGNNNSWSVRINKNGQTDNFNVVVLCANQ